MKKKISKNKPKAKPSPDAGLPAADQRIAKHKRIEKSETDALHKEICTRVGRLRDVVEKTGEKIIAMSNEARAIGLLITEAWDKLAGKQMTIDFWEQQQDLYRDSKDRKIELDWLKWMVRVSRELPEPLTLETGLRQALGMRQQLFLLADFHLEGEAPYLTNGAGGNDKNFFNLIRVQAEKFTRQFNTIIKGLEDDAKFGPVSKWPTERKAMVRSKVEPLFKEVSAFMQKLEAVDI